MTSFDLFGDVSFRFHSFRRRFLASRTYEIHVNASIAVKVHGGISFLAMAENWKHLKDILAFSSFFMC